MKEIVYIVFLAIMIIIAFYLALKKARDQEIISYVFINKKTKKYHQKECPYSENLNSTTLSEAIKEGYTPCKICNKI